MRLAAWRGLLGLLAPGRRQARALDHALVCPAVPGRDASTYGLRGPARPPPALPRVALTDFISLADPSTVMRYE